MTFLKTHPIAEIKEQTTGPKSVKRKTLGGREETEGPPLPGQVQRMQVRRAEPE